MMTPPIPATASADDVLWHAAFHELATELVRLRAKSKLVVNLCGCSQKTVRELYQAIHSEGVPYGPIPLTSPRELSKPGKHVPFAKLVESTLFLEIYQQLSHSFSFTPHKGWLLFSAYSAYQSLAGADPKLDIHSCYSLLVHSGWNEKSLSSLIRTPCKECGLLYVVRPDIELEDQECPVCLVNRRYRRLAQAGLKAVRTAEAVPVAA